MIKPKSTSAALPRHLPTLTVLGLSDHKDGEWSRLRGLQYSSLARVTKLRIAVHALAAAGVIRLYVGSVHIAVLMVWLVLLGASLVHGAKIDKALNDEPDPLIHQAKMEGLVPRNFGKSDVLREAIRKELPVFRDKV